MNIQEVIPSINYDRTNLGWQALVARHAVEFFSARRNSESLNAIGKNPTSGSLTTLNGTDFMKYLEVAKFHDNAWSHVMNIQRILDSLVRVGLLIDVGQGTSPIMGRYYWHLGTITTSQARGDLWLSEALGAELVIPSYASVTVPLTGTASDGEVRIGTGLVVDSHHVLTCAHVVRDMTLDEKIERSTVMPPIIWGLVPFGEMRIVAWHVHDTVDVAILEVAGRGFLTLGGLTLRDAGWADRVTLFGYPPVPMNPNADLIVQRGEVVNPSIAGMHGQTLFLYSAIARPGNSGGPIVASDGRVPGLVTQELLNQGRPQWPFFAGVPAGEVSRAAQELGFPDLLTLETWKMHNNVRVSEAW